MSYVHVGAVDLPAALKPVMTIQPRTTTQALTAAQKQTAQVQVAPVATPQPEVETAAPVVSAQPQAQAPAPSMPGWLLPAGGALLAWFLLKK